MNPPDGKEAGGEDMCRLHVFDQCRIRIAFWRAELL